MPLAGTRATAELVLLPKLAKTVVLEPSGKGGGIKASQLGPVVHSIGHEHVLGLKVIEEQ